MLEILKSILILSKPKLSLMVLVSAIAGIYLSDPLHTQIIDVLVFSIPFLFLVFGACMMNCYIERESDKRMQRTFARVDAIKVLSEEGVIAISLFFMTLSTYALYKYINVLVCLMGVIAAILYLYVYTPLKSRSHAALYIGAIPGALPPVMGYAVRGDLFSMKLITLFLLLFIWQIPHFMAISIYHFNDYKKAKTYVLPFVHGEKYTKNAILFFTLLLVLINLIPVAFWQSHFFSFSSLILVSSAVALLLLAIEGVFFCNSKSANQIWARKYFFGTVFYLPGTLLGMLFL